MFADGHYPVELLVAGVNHPAVNKTFAVGTVNTFIAFSTVQYDPHGIVSAYNLVAVIYCLCRARQTIVAVLAIGAVCTILSIFSILAIDDRTPHEKRDTSDRAEMLRIFRDVLEDKEIPEEKLKRLLDKEFAKDVSLKGYTDEILLNEVDGMTDMLYEKQGSYLQGQQDLAKALIEAGKITADEAEYFSRISAKRKQEK